MNTIAFHLNFSLFSFSQENVGGTTYFYPTAANHSANQTSSSIVTDSSLSLSHHSSSQNISYTQPVHVYPGPASNVVNMQPRTQLSSAIFIPDEMRNDILARNEIANIVDSIPNPGEIPTSNHNIYIYGDSSLD